MTDIFQPNPAPNFTPHPPEATEPVPEKPANGRKGRRGPRQSKTAAEKKPKANSRKQSAVSVAPPPKPKGIVLDLPTAIAALAGTTEEDGKFITAVVEGMQAFDADQRRRIVTALARMFS